MKKSIKEMDVVDMDELIERVEEEAIRIENEFLKLFPEVPVFDFEINWSFILIIS